MTTAEQSLGHRMALSLRLIERLQHPSGEILSYRRDEHDNSIYCRSPLLSTFVHDALDCFDPTAAGWSDRSLEVVPPPAQAWFARTVVGIRRRIRAFLRWQQESSGSWRLFGRFSGMDPDANTTACATLALADGSGPGWLAGSARRLDAVLAFRSGAGPFYTFRKPGRGGYGWLDEAGRAIVGFDRVVNVAVLECLARVGDPDAPDTRRLADWLLHQATTADLASGTALYPNPVTFLYRLGRAWSRNGLPRRPALTAALTPALLRAQGPAGDFRGPLSTAMGATALLDTGHRGPELDRARAAVLRGLHPNGGWGYEDAAVQGFGSPALSTALSMAFLAADPDAEPGTGQ